MGVPLKVVVTKTKTEQEWMEDVQATYERCLADPSRMIPIDEAEKRFMDFMAKLRTEQEN